jgi:hypothetical protein
LSEGENAEIEDVESVTTLSGIYRKKNQFLEWMKKALRTITLHFQIQVCYVESARNVK